MHAAQLLKSTAARRLLLAVFALLPAACTSHTHTLESTKDLTRAELVALCADLEIRATQDCEWNMRDQQSQVRDQQTWEINCRARRDSARESFENVCLDARSGHKVPAN